MKCLFYFLSLVLLSTIIVGCKVQSSALDAERVLRQAEDVPDHFSPLQGISLDNKSCKNPLVDSRSGLKIILRSAQNGLGKYEVPEGTYGVKKGEALLLDCSTGQVKGIIPLK